MIVRAFVIELDQPDYWYSPNMKFLKIYVQIEVNGELFSCEIADSGRVLSRELERHTFIQYFMQISSLKRIIKICSKFYCWVSKLLSTHHIVVWGNSPLNPGPDFSFKTPMLWTRPKIYWKYVKTLPDCLFGRCQTYYFGI